MEDLSLHILDIAENAVSAGARNLSIGVTEDLARDLLSIVIADDGRGMSADAVRQADDPFFTTRTTRRVGLGLALLREAATAANGSLEIRSTPGAGTTVRATFQLSHIDRKPLGSMAETITALMATAAEIDIEYTRTRNGRSLVLDTKEIRRQLDGMLLNSVGALSLIRDYLRKEENSLGQ
jgi:K+-sensing histidine kinase KdpD